MTDQVWHLSTAARDAIHTRLRVQHKSVAIPLSQILRDVRADAPSLLESDEDLINHIVTEATNQGLAIHFD